jgi:hypothetical protein
LKKRRSDDGFSASPECTREGVRISRRYQLRLPEPLASELEAFACERDVGVCPAIRLLVASGLRAEGRPLREPEESRDSPAALAALTAAELVVLMVASVLPEGQRRMHELAPDAALAAEERLALFRDSGQ